jgi:hypothetical protein
MADSKLSDLTDISPNLTTDDLVYCVNNPGGTPASRKATIAELFALGATVGVTWNAVVAASDQDISSQTTPQNDSELFFSLTAAKLYAFDLDLVYSSPVGAGTPDLKFAFAGPATLTGQWSIDMWLTTADAAGTISQSTALTTTGTIGTAATPRMAHIIGWCYSTGGGSGSSGLILQWSQNTSGANATRRHAGSTLRYRQVQA